MRFPKKEDKVNAHFPLNSYENLLRDEEGNWTFNRKELTLEEKIEMEQKLWPYIRELSDALKLLQLDINIDKAKKLTTEETT